MPRMWAATASGIWVVLVCLMGAPCAVGAETNGDESQVLQTLVRGVLHRADMIRTVEVTARVRWVLSDRYKERLAGRARDALAGAPGALRSSIRGPGHFDPAPTDFRADDMEGEEYTYVRYKHDVGARRRQSEEVALTNRGSPDVACMLAPRPADRDVPPWLLYTSTVCDDERTYIYDRSGNRGVVAYSRPVLPSLHGSYLDSWVVLGLGSWQIAGLRDGTYKARYLGEATGADVEHFHFHELELLAPPPPTDDQWVVTRVRLSPDKGFAVVAWDRVIVGSDAQTGAAPFGLESAKKCTYGGFVEVADGLWFPMRVQLDDFDYMLGDGMDAWMCSRVYEVTELRVNEPVEIAAPYVFPFDARVMDLTAPTPRVGPDPEVWMLPPPADPPPLGPLLTTEKVMDIARRALDLAESAAADD